MKSDSIPFAGRLFAPAYTTPLHDKASQAMLAALRAVHTRSAAGAAGLDGLDRQRQSQRLLGRLSTPELGFSWEPFSADGLSMAWARPDGACSPHRAVLYCHGGGYTSGSLDYARVLASRLAKASGCGVLAFEYRLAPEHPHPAALEDALSAWDHLMRLGFGARDVALAGDSAGGNLALCLTAALRDAGRQTPGRLVLYSPWTDMSCSSASYERHADDDPILTREYLESVRAAYAPRGGWQDPAFSPLFADLRGFPPVLIQVGGHEILADDSARLKQRLDEAGVPCVLQCWPQMWHVFVMFPLPAALEAMEQTVLFLSN